MRVYLRSLRSKEREKRFTISSLAHWENTAEAALQCYRSALNHVLTESPLERPSKRLGALGQFRTPSDHTHSDPCPLLPTGRR
jgi:hypothetical protein